MTTFFILTPVFFRENASDDRRDEQPDMNVSKNPFATIYLGTPKTVKRQTPTTQYKSYESRFFKMYKSQYETESMSSNANANELTIANDLLNKFFHFRMDLCNEIQEYARQPGGNNLRFVSLDSALYHFMKHGRPKMMTYSEYMERAKQCLEHGNQIAQPPDTFWEYKGWRLIRNNKSQIKTLFYI